jgi:hypothetical protein
MEAEVELLGRLEAAATQAGVATQPGQYTPCWYGA